MKNAQFKMTKAALTNMTKAFRRAVAVMAMGLAYSGFCAGTVPSGLVVAGVSGVMISAVTATPAHAACLIGGTMRADIAEGDCLEAQRTGCIRSKLNSEQYTNCLAANKPFKGKRCIINGKVRGDLSTQDCEEANATGCVRRLLSAKQYENCLNAQPN
jgi:hypothetical protein